MNMLAVTYATQDVVTRLAEIAAVYRRAFSGHPWFLAWTQQHAQDLILEAQRHERFEAFLGLGMDEEVVAAHWYYPLCLSQIAAELCPSLAAFAQEQVTQHQVSIIVYEKAIFVDPLYQGHGVAKQVRAIGFATAPELYDKQRSILWLTRHRSDNTPVIRLSERMGFASTGVSMPSLKEDAPHHFYYKLSQ